MGSLVSDLGPEWRFLKGLLDFISNSGKKPQDLYLKVGFRGNSAPFWCKWGFKV